ncbi:uncharacterized protein LOC132264365 isoform X2 [Phlebotomus argentipes]|uniref:uncharacterized protein LOC132264365 isoform X2 n=1 Tax=Phlebotomus argentipes TaxID=94469 RepID=UPI0028936ED4|nr:uncharacterized protein LOC132264365 isoform X2 [Phlebotomus argentipes]
MSKLSFRARALDPSKPLPIYLTDELPDLPEYSAINRAVPQMPSGMEKEEESEHHLQRAICTGLIIPTPEVFQTDPEFYDRNYPKDYKMPRQMIHMQPFNMEQDIPDYDMDSGDEVWVNSRLDLNPYKFEQMMDRLEKSSGQTVITLNEAKALLKQDDEISIAVYDYWLNKRLKTQHPLILSVKTENRGGQTANNPYLAFRRRTEKMQTRKNRKNDEASYEKMLKLRRDLSRAVTLLEMIKRREKAKREHLHLSIEVFEKRYQVRDYSGHLLAEYSSSASKNARSAFAPLLGNQYSHMTGSHSSASTAMWANSNNLSYSQYSGHHHHSQMYGVKGDLDMNLVANSGSSRKEKRQYKKRKHKYIPRGTQGGSLAAGGNLIPGGGDSLVSSEDDELLYNLSGAPEMPEEEGVFAFRRNLNCQYKRPIHSGVGGWSRASRGRHVLPDYRCKFTLGAVRPRERAFVRRRIGRGGRVVIDRLSGNVDDVWSKLDYTIFDSWKAQKEAEQPIVVKLEEAEGDQCNGQEGAEEAVLKVEDAVTNHVNPLRESEEVCDGVEWRSEEDLADYEEVVPQDVRDMMRKGDFTVDSLSCYHPKSPDLHVESPRMELDERDYALEIQAIEDRSLTCDLLLSDNVFYPTPFTLDDLISSSDLNLDSDLAAALQDTPVDPEVTVGCSQFAVADMTNRRSDQLPSKARSSRRASAERMEVEQNIADTSNDSDDVPLVAYQIESQAAAAAAAQGASTSASEPQSIVLGLSTASRSVLNGSQDSKNVVARGRSLFQAVSTGGGQQSLVTLTQTQPVFLTHQPVFQGANKVVMHSASPVASPQKVVVAQPKGRFSQGPSLKVNSAGLKASESTTVGHLATTADGKIATIKSQPARGLNMVIDVDRKRIMYANLKNSGAAVTSGQQFVTQINPRMVNIVPIQQIKTTSDLQGVQAGASSGATASPTQINNTGNAGR